jgi:hypothetical protein
MKRLLWAALLLFSLSCSKPPATADGGAKVVEGKDAGVAAAPPFDEAACVALEDKAAAEALRAKQACLEGMATRLDAVAKQRKVTDAAVADASDACSVWQYVRGVGVPGVIRVPERMKPKRTPKARAVASAAEARDEAKCLGGVADELEAAVAAGDAAKTNAVRAKVNGCGPKSAGILSLLGGLAPTAAPPWPLGPLDLRCFDSLAFADAVGDAFDGDSVGGSGLGIGLDSRKPGQSGFGSGRFLLKGSGGSAPPKQRKPPPPPPPPDLVAVGTAPVNTARVESALTALLCSRARRVRCCHEVSQGPDGATELFVDVSADGGIARVEVPSLPAFGACVDSLLTGTPLGIAPEGGKARYLYRAKHPRSVIYPPDQDR